MKKRGFFVVGGAGGRLQTTATSSSSFSSHNFFYSLPPRECIASTTVRQQQPTPNRAATRLLIRKFASGTSTPRRGGGATITNWRKTQKRFVPPSSTTQLTAFEFLHLPLSRYASTEQDNKEAEHSELTSVQSTTSESSIEQTGPEAPFTWTEPPIADTIDLEPTIFEQAYSFLPQTVASSLEFVHTFTGMPYWSVIVAGSIALRLALLPFYIKAQKATANLSNIAGELKATIDRIPSQYPNLDAKALKKRQQAEALRFYSSKGLSPFDSIIYGIMPVPFYMVFFFGVMRMCNQAADISTGGFAWFVDLATPDPFGRLAILSGLTMWASIEGLAATNQQPTPEYMRWIWRAVSGFIVWVTWNFNPGIHIYWITMSAITFTQGYLLARPNVRQMLGIPLLKKTIPPVPPVIPKMVYKKSKPNQ